MELTSKEDRRFFEYHGNNPKIYELLVMYAREAKKTGLLRYSIDAVMHRVRWEVNIATIDTARYKISNDYTSRYSRLIMKQEPDLKGFFQIKQMRTHTRLND